jgi:Putative methyltransferase
MMWGMTLRDYVAWHDAYDKPGSGLHLRLLTVQDLIAAELDEAPPGPVRVISMCAGQGRDLIGVGRRHRRGGDLTGLLVEADPRNAATAREAIGQAGLDGLTVEQGDAGKSDSYLAAEPASLLLAAGIFGNISREDIKRTIRFLPALCAPGALVIWTRHPEPDGIMQAIEGWFAAAGFRPEALIVPEGNLFGVGAARLTGTPPPLRAGGELFTFT